MLGSNIINFTATTLSNVSTSASDVMDLYDQFNEKKKNYIATKIAFDDKKRAGAAAIGAAGGLAEAVLFTGIYGILKAFPKLNIPILNKYITGNFDKWIGIAAAQNPTKSKLSNIALGLSTKYLWSILYGAAIGFGLNLLNTFKNTRVNGEISTCKTGANGSWISSGLSSLASSKEGAKIIKDSIMKNDDNSITIKFKGVDKEYNISKKELSEASKAYVAITDENGDVKDYEKKFSKGDGDILAFELAFEKYCKDVQNGIIPKDKNVPCIGQKISEDGDILFMNGSANQMFYLLTGNKTFNFEKENLKENPIMDMYTHSGITQILKDMTNNDKFAASIKLREGEKNKLLVRDKTNKIHKLKTDREYSITGINSKYVTISNSAKTKEKIDIPISKLNNYIASVEYIKLDKE